MNILIPILVFFFLNSNVGFSQNDTLNQVDSRGKKIGYWELCYPGIDSILYGKGYYNNNVKVGEWNFYFENGNSKSKFFYVNKRYSGNQRQGDYELYYPDGCLMEKGNLGVCLIPSGMDRQEVICNEGEVTMFYSDTCNILVYRRMFESGRQLWIIKYDRNGFPSDTIFDENYFRDLVPIRFNYGQTEVSPSWDEDTSAVEKREIIVNSYAIITEEDIAAGGVSYIGGVSKNGYKLNHNGYNKVYNTDGNLWLDGEFKYGYLYHGKRYLYNEDGILQKIEIWKNGKYYSDGQL